MLVLLLLLHNYVLILLLSQFQHFHIHHMFFFFLQPLYMLLLLLLPILHNYVLLLIFHYIEDITEGISIQEFKNSITTKTLYQLYFSNFDTIEQALTTKSKKELAFDYLIKHFNIELQENTELNGNVWGRLVSIQAKEDEGEWDTTATANLVDYEEEFNVIKEMVK